MSHGYSMSHNLKVASDYSLISFDLQGTLSDSAFSDEFWLKLLPELYAKKMDISVEEAKAELRNQFKQMGKYHRLYYCARSWLDELCPGRSVADIVSELSNPPHLYQDSLRLVEELAAASVPLIILSTTIHDFIELELNEARQHFSQVYSTLDDFAMPGKSAQAFKEAAQRCGVEVGKILHIGDCPEMDIKNAQEAGCQTFFFDKAETRQQVLANLRSLLIT